SGEGTFVAVEVPLREQPAQLTLTAPGGAEVSVDGRPYGTAPLAALELPSGAHTLTITRTGKRPVLRNLNLERGTTTPLSIRMRDTSQRTGAYAVLGVAAAAALGGGALGVAAVVKEGEAKGVLSQASQHTIVASQLDRYNAALDTRDRLRTAAAVTLGAAGALGITGIALFAFDNPSIQREDLGPRSGTQSPRSPGTSPLAATFVPLPG